MPYEVSDDATRVNAAPLGLSRGVLARWRRADSSGGGRRWRVADADGAMVGFARALGGALASSRLRAARRPLGTSCIEASRAAPWLCPADAPLRGSSPPPPPGAPARLGR